ncbi:ribose transport system substrate-binding protein [Gracilibacillus ureilyticus]|uniref:Ribose transport system substrate-binding protein n=1 Tax=Gracilibacillus ureilyticus TaxID=531814 RepID=A0A1H9R9I6_9BACI|nr:substrate-binding domain-containing protein [Gracilibacillus ureilyticus]SER69205.1 ribose transport system substrate-binding protein [Gracilibacillus ureilyticus]
MKKWIFAIIALSVLISIFILFTSIEQPLPQEDLVIDMEEKSSDYTFAIIYPVAHPFFEKVTKTAREHAADLGVNIVIDAPKVASAEDQAMILQKYIDQQVDGIAIGPTDPETITPIINEAIDEGIPVVCFDTDAPNSNRYAYIGTDNYLAGLHLGETVAKHLDYRGDILVSSGLPTMENLRLRIEGLKAAVEQYPQLEIEEIAHSNGTHPDTLANIEKLVENHPEFEGFVGIDSLAGPAAITVWKAHGLNKTAVTFDDLPVTLEGVKNGQITSAISQNQSKWGELLVNRLFELINEEIVKEKEYTDTIEIDSISK